MNAVGIDVSKGKSTVAILRPFGEVVALPFEVRHTAKELHNLANQLKDLDGETRVVMEHTGRYYEPIANILYESGVFVSAVNALLIKEYGGNSLRKVKTDKADSVKIARYALDNWAELRKYSREDTTRYNLKTLNRQYQLASKQKVECTNNLIALLDQSFPGVKTLFTSMARVDGSQKWIDFVETFYHADCVRGLSQNAFAARYKSWCNRKRYNFSEAKAIEVHSFAKQVVVTTPKSPLIKMLIQQSVSQVYAVTAALVAYRSEMNVLASQLPEYPVVMDMFGVGDSVGPQLMAEIGDVRKYSSKQALVAFAGLDPMPNQSGTKNIRSNKTSKRGSPYLRKTLFTIMSVTLQNKPADDPVYQFLDKKRAEGKPFYVYMTAGANKFLRRYYGKVTEHLREKAAAGSNGTADAT